MTDILISTKYVNWLLYYNIKGKKCKFEGTVYKKKSQSG